LSAALSSVSSVLTWQTCSLYITGLAVTRSQFSTRPTYLSSRPDSAWVIPSIPWPVDSVNVLEASHDPAVRLSVAEV
jgi:hypothetical protein